MRVIEFVIYLSPDFFRQRADLYLHSDIGLALVRAHDVVHAGIQSWVVFSGDSNTLKVCLCFLVPNVRLWPFYDCALRLFKHLDKSLIDVVHLSGMQM